MFEGEKVAQGAAVLVQLGAVTLELVVVTLATSALKRRDGVGVHVMILPIHPPMVHPAVGKVVVGALVGRTVSVELLSAQVFEPKPRNAAERAAKARVHHLPVQAQGLKNLGALVTLECGDAHLGEDFKQAVPDGFAVPFNRIKVCVQNVIRLVVRPETARAQVVPQNVVHHVRVDGIGTIAQQGGHVVRCPSIAALHNDCDVGSHTLFNQMVVDSAHCQQGRNWRLVFVGVAV